MVTVTIDNGNKVDTIEIIEADSFGISRSGDLIAVKMVQRPIAAGQMGEVGENLETFAAGHWIHAKVVQNKIRPIQTPGQA